MNQLVICGATVVDGLGNDPARADVAVRDGRLTAIGDVRDEMAALGLTTDLITTMPILRTTTQIGALFHLILLALLWNRAK